MDQRLTARGFRFSQLAWAVLLGGSVAGASMGLGRAAPPAGVRVTVRGADAGHTNQQLQQLISAGVAQGLARRQVPSKQGDWVFDVQARRSHRPEIVVLASYRNARGAIVHCDLASASLDTAPSAVFVSEIGRLAGNMVDGGMGCAG